MILKNVFLTLFLWLLWIVFVEDLGIGNLAAGLILSIICVAFAQKFLPLAPIRDVKILRILYWPLYILGQIYVAGFQVMGTIITGGKALIVEVETDIKCETLRYILSKSTTITPGTIFMDLKDNKITVLWLRPKNSKNPQTAEEYKEAIIGAMERKLKKADIS